MMASLFSEAKWFKNVSGTKPCNFSMNDYYLNEDDGRKDLYDKELALTESSCIPEKKPARQ